jgi:hypothetical protein
LSLLVATPQYLVAPRVAVIVLVYLTCLGSLLCVQLARRGRHSYWLGAAGALLLVFGVLWGRGFVSSGVTYAATAIGIALLIFAAAIDLVFGPPFGSPQQDPTGK